MQTDDHSEVPPMTEDEGAYFYEDGLGEADLLDDEADFASAPKRREQTRRAALRQDTPRVVRSARKHRIRDARRHDLRAVRHQYRMRARAHWERSLVRPVFGAWSRMFGSAPTSAIQALMLNAFLQRANRLFIEKIEGSTSLSDLGSVSVKTMIAAALVAGLDGRPGSDREKALEQARRIYDGLSLAEKFVEIVVKARGSGEIGYEDEDEDELFASYDDEDFEAGLRTNSRDAPDGWDMLDEDDEDQMAAAPKSKTATQRQCAQALRQAARYLLKIERQLVAGHGRT